MPQVTIRSKVLYSLSILFIFILFGCKSSEDVRPQVSIPVSPELEGYIDPEIQGEEREFMLQILAALPEDAWDDVVHLNEDGTIYTNRVANKGQITVVQKDEVTGEWLDQNSNPYPLALPSQTPQPIIEEPIDKEPIDEPPAIRIEPLAAVTPRCGVGLPGTADWGKPDGTGIEFRMHTKPGGSSATVPPLVGSSVRGYVPSKASGNLLVDDPTGYRDSSGYHPFGCTHDVRQDNPSTQAVEPYGETPYVYLGGWGDSGERVDAGLQFNCATTNTTNPADPEYPYRDYTLALFFLGESFGAINDIRANRFASGQWIDLKFTASSALVSINGTITHSGILRITATGLDVTRTTMQTKTITVLDNSWDSYGIDNIFSLSASVAQTPRAATGTYYVSSITQKSIFKGIILSNLKVIKPQSCGCLPPFATVNWNGYNLTDPLTGSNGICRVPYAYTGTGLHPIQIITSSPYSTSAASTAGIRVDLTVK
jgi:hypothetical protein